MLSLILVTTLIVTDKQPSTSTQPLTSAQVETLYLRHTRGSSISSRHEARNFSRLIWKESRNNPAAKNKRSSAFGLGQLIKSQRARYGGSDPKDIDGQIKAVIHYIGDRYGKPSRANKHHIDKGYY